MARFPGMEPVIEAAARWRDSCLVGEGSILSSHSLWTADHVDELWKHFVLKPDEGRRSFLQKLQRQLKPATAGTRMLAAEMLWLIYLFPRRMTGNKKIENIRTVWELSDSPFPAGHSFLEVLHHGIGYAGPGLLAHLPRELTYLVTIMRDLKGKPEGERKQLASDPWTWAAWLDGFPDTGRRQLRHILRFLLFPDYFEPMASEKHKRLIIEKLAPPDGGEGIASPYDLVALDRGLLALRENLQQQYGGQLINFYRPPLRQQWLGDEPTEELDSVGLNELRAAFLREYPTSRASPTISGSTTRSAATRQNSGNSSVSSWNSGAVLNVPRLTRKAQPP
jgi:5-methylcytosine-specific restriction enzyme B